MTEKNTKEFNKMLAEKYGLTPTDFWKSEGGKWIISSFALKKIARMENLHLIIENIAAVNNFVVATVTAQKAFISFEGKEYFVKHQAVGSACDLSCSTKIAKAYMPEMAVKRAEDRAIIQALNFDEVVYSDSESDSFKEKTNESEIELETETPKKATILSVTQIENDGN